MAVRDLTLPAIGPRLSEFARRSGLAEFWPWWTAQLNALVPPRPRAALERRRMRPVLVFEGDHATLWRPAMEGERAVMATATSIPLTGDAATVAGAGRAAMASLTSGSYGASAVSPKVVLSIPGRELLRKTLTLPAAVEPNLRQTLVYDLDRHTPFKPEEIYFDVAVVGRDPKKKEIRVDLVSCRKAIVDAAMRHAATWGAAVSAAVPEPPVTAAASRLNLLPHEVRPSLAVWKRWQFWLPLALVAAVALAAIAIPLWQKRDYAIALNGLAAQARAQAEVSDALRTELETKVADYNFALDKKYAYPSAFRVVDEVSRVLPDDTWLTQMELKSIAKGKEAQREILVRGETANAGRLVQLVEESPLFAQTTPRSPTTKIQPGPGEIFDLGAQVKPLAAPAQVALLGAERPAEPVVAAPGAATSAAPSATPAASPSTPATRAAEMGPEAPTAAAPTATPVTAPPTSASTTTAPPTISAGTAPAPDASPPPAAAAKPVGLPSAPAATTAAPRSSAPPPAGTPDPWISAPSAAQAPRPARPQAPVVPAGTEAPKPNATTGAKP
jgi:general secretion pathway protein L